MRDHQATDSKGDALSLDASPLVTVAIPTHNRAGLLGETVRNVLEQSRRDIEAIVSDNGSTDDTASVVASFQDPRLRYAPLERNIGWHRNFSRCLRLGTAPLVVVFPDDDLMDPDNLDRKLRLLRDDSEIDIVHSDYRLVAEDGVEILQDAMRYVRATGVTIAPGPVVLERLLTWDYWINPPAAVIRRSVVEDEGFREADGTVAELGFFLRLLMRARKVVYIPEPLVSRRIHPGADTIELHTHEVESGSYRPTFAEIGRAVRLKRRFLAEYGSRLTDLRGLEETVRRADERQFLMRISQKSGADRTATTTLRVLGEAAREEPTLLLTGRALRYLLGGLAGPSARRIGRAFVRRSPRRSRDLTGSEGEHSDDGRISVLFVSHSALLYGAERSLLELVKALHGSDIVRSEVVLPAAGPLADELRDLGTRCWIMPYGRWASGRVSFRRKLSALRGNIAAVGRFRRLIRRTQPTVVVTNTITIPSPAVAAYLAKIPHIWYVHEYGLEAHGAGLHWGTRPSLTIVGRLSALVLVPSQALRRHLARWIAPGRIRLLPVAVETPDTARPLADRTVRPFRVVVVGHKTIGKRQEDAVRAVAIVRDAGMDVTLALVGSGDPDYVSLLRRLAEELGVTSRVEFIEYEDDPFEVLGHSHVALSCSRLEGGLPRVLIEGMKSGCAVIGARSGGTEDLIVDGWNGLLYRPGDVQDLAAKIGEVYEDGTRSDALARNAQNWALEHFTPDILAAGFVKVLSEISTRDRLNHGSPEVRENVHVVAPR